MTDPQLLDMFAAHAIMGAAGLESLGSGQRADPDTEFQRLARNAYSLANAMLAEHKARNASGAQGTEC